MKHCIVIFKPDDRQISIHAGATLVDAAGQAGIILDTVCGGKGTCGKCKVVLEPGGEQVLACQYRVQSDITVSIPQSARFFEHKILEHGIDIESGISPTTGKRYLGIDSADRIFGLAVDIGTTTVVARLINLTDGRCLATQAAINPQIRYGDDCISRISYAGSDEKLIELHKVIIGCLNELIDRLCKKASIDTNQIYEVCAVGNTTMNHIFLKLPIKQLGQAPYKAFSLDAKDVPAAKLSLRINPAGNIHTPGNIAGFVGSDTIAVALAVDIGLAEEMTLAVDIGTNGEIVLGTADKLYAASCAAGPAFEGARITYGSRAAEGAIETVVMNNGDIAVDVIGGCEPRSICGSGLIDAVAVLLDLGIVDATGRFVERGKLKGRLPAKILSRVVEQDGQPAFIFGRSQNDGGTVLLTQRDIRQIQLAKAAVRAGIKLLQGKISLKDDDIKQVLLAGAFGNYIRRENALRVGLLPDVPAERIRFVGNAAASGAQMILLNSALRAEAERLARRIEYVEIANEPDFQMVFADCMLF